MRRSYQNENRVDSTIIQTHNAGPMNKRRAFDIAILGWGTRGIEQMTVENLYLLKKSRFVAVSPGAPQELWDLLKDLKIRVHDLSIEYREGDPPREVYQRIARKVLRLGQKWGGVVFLQYGHPLIYSLPTQLVLAESESRGLDTRILPGISSIDQILCLLGEDIANRGIQICHAGPFFLHRQSINPRMDLILMQIGRVGEKTICLNVSERAQRVRKDLYRRLQRHLERFYPRKHPMTVICLQGALNRSDQVIRATVADLLRIAPFLHVGHTAYIKGIG